MPLIRCYWYSEDGWPLKGNGCRRSNCAFIHPDNEHWESAIPPSYVPAFLRDSNSSNRHETYKGEDRSRDRDRDRDRDRERDREDNRWHRHNSRSPRRERTAGGRTHRPGYSERSRERSREHSEYERSRDKRIMDDAEHRSQHSRNVSHSSIGSSIKMAPHPPTDAAPTSSKSGNLPVDHAPVASTNMPSTRAGGRDLPLMGSDTTASGPSQNSISMAARPPVPAPAQSTSMPPPPPPPSAQPMQPVLPLPSVPEGLRLVPPPPPPPEPSEEEKAKIWDLRVKLLSESAKAYELWQTQEDEYQSALTATQSNFFTALRTEDQARLTGQLATLAQKRDEAKHEYENVQKRILNEASWPAAPPQILPEDRARHFELVKYVNVLNSNVEKMKKLLGDITTVHKPPERLFLPSDSDDEDVVMMDLDEPVPGTSSNAPLTRKRRRTGDPGDDIRGYREDMPTQKDLDEVRDQLLVFDDQLRRLQNEYNHFETDIKASLDDAVDDKVKEIERARLKKQAARDKQRNEEDAKTKLLIEDTQKKVADADKDITELSTEVSDLTLKVDELSVKVDEARKTKDNSLQRMEEINKRLQKYTDMQQTNANTIEALNSAVQAYLTRPPSPVAPPVPVAPSILLESLREPLIDVLRKEMKPLVEQVRKNTEDLVKEKNEVLFTTTWAKVVQTLNVLKKVQESIERGGQGQSQVAH